jgi:phosphoribosyl 1,2-cyclic phosphodiesterase
LAAVAKKLKIPVYLTHQTAPAIDWGDCGPRLETFQAGRGFCVGDFEVTSFTIPHDAVDPVGYTLCAEGIRVGVATDLGYVTDSIKVHLRRADLLLIESNHDLGMLKDGPYPWSVKQRVMSRRGHLSNDVAAAFIREDLDHTVSTLILGHLSQHNNHPELARRAALEALDGRTLFTKLVVAEPGIQSEVFTY